MQNNAKNINSNYVMMSIPYIGIFADGAEQWCKKIGLNASRFNDEEKEYYVKLRQAHKLFEMSYEEYETLLLDKFHESDEYFYNIRSLLEKIINYYNVGTDYCNGAVCLQEAPLTAIAENLQYEEKLRKEENHKVRYLGFGIRFQKNFIYKKNGRPVIYDETNRVKEYLPENEWWRIVKLDLSNKEHIIDWTHEREWRVPGELCFEYSQCEIIVPNSKYYKKFVKYCLGKNREDILLKIRGVVVMASVYF